MDISINFLAVSLAAIVSGALGWIFYLPRFLGGIWIRLARIDVKKLNSKFALAMAALSLLLMSLALATIAYIVHSFLRHSFLEDTLLTAIFIFIGFQAFRILQLAEFNQRPRLETLLHILHELMITMVMALIIGLLGYA